ncbi:PREDICTED: uncharacterized protein LOC107357953 [Acropora digitifera]|uniref:uncharacterized protein LOC107357953 n=1 Tax=Acropora digitifera TaxID=70779 RepID=UPI00077A7BAB|nr:PREDICTED: uncharacterized protein LOC107357953 [Acropora digitifera]
MPQVDLRFSDAKRNGPCFLDYNDIAGTPEFQIFLTMSERRSLGARAPANRAVQVSASSQPPNKPLRTRDPVQTANLTDKAHPSWPNHKLQHLLSAPQPIRQNLQFQHMLLALPTKNCDGMAERSKAMRSGRRVLLSLPWHH